MTKTDEVIAKLESLSAKLQRGAAANDDDIQALDDAVVILGSTQKASRSATSINDYERSSYCGGLGQGIFDGNLPAGIHEASLSEIAARLARTGHRTRLMKGLIAALRNLKHAGCQRVFLDGSYVTSKIIPEDYDGCWDIAGVDPTLLDPVLLTFDAGRASQKAKYFGELFPAQQVELASGNTFLEFFQIDRESGLPKGIVSIDLRKEEL